MLPALEGAWEDSDSGVCLLYDCMAVVDAESDCMVDIEGDGIGSGEAAEWVKGFRLRRAVEVDTKEARLGDGPAEPDAG